MSYNNQIKNERMELQLQLVLLTVLHLAHFKKYSSCVTVIFNVESGFDQPEDFILRPLILETRALSLST